MTTEIYTDEQLETLYASARRRLQSLRIGEDLIEDESGQTAVGEHQEWLTTASDEEILQWVQDMAN